MAAISKRELIRLREMERERKRERGCKEGRERNRMKEGGETIEFRNRLRKIGV